jgi:hypothetical protein
MIMVLTIRAILQVNCNTTSTFLARDAAGPMFVARLRTFTG